MHDIIECLIGHSVAPAPAGATFSQSRSPGEHRLTRCQSAPLSAKVTSPVQSCDIHVNYQ